MFLDSTHGISSCDMHELRAADMLTQDKARQAKESEELRPHARFADRLRNLICERGLTFKEASMAIGANKGIVSQWIRGGSSPKHESLVLLLKYFGEDGACLIREEE